MRPDTSGFFQNTNPYGSMSSGGASNNLGSSGGNSGMSMMESLGMGGLIGGGLGSLFGMFGNSGPNPSDTIGKIPGQVSPYLQPYMDAGKSQLGPLAGLYGQMTSDPGGMLNQMGQSYHQSPGFQFALQQALQGAGHGAAAGGMAGSPMAQQQNMGIATQMGNQDYYNWLNQAKGMFGQGLEGRQNLAGMGQEGGESMANMISQALAQQAQAQYAQQAQQNQEGGGIGSLLGGGIGLIAHHFGL